MLARRAIPERPEARRQTGPPAPPDELVTEHDLERGAWNWSVADETLEESGHFTMNLQEGSMEEMAMDTTLPAIG